MQFYYLDEENKLQGPFPLKTLHDLYKVHKLTLDTLTMAVGSEQWQPLRETLKQLESEKNGEPAKYFRLSSTDQMQITEIPILKKNDKIILLRDYAQLADGTRRKILLRGEDEGPTTPLKAIEAFIKAQRTAVAVAQHNLNKETELLEKAERMLIEARKRESELSDESRSA